MGLKFSRFFAIFVACASLILFLEFIFNGPLDLVRMRLNRPVILVWDALISIVFFAQHSGMIRRGFSSWLAGAWPPVYYRIVFTITSGIVLAVVMVTWQPSTIVLYEFHGVSRLLFRGLFFLGLAGCFWGLYTLRSSTSFDPFGLQASSKHLSGEENRPPQLVIRGPYAHVRHPVYLMVILLIWSCPDVTADRLLFNILWTLWMYVGATLEDADMRMDFGDAYLEYRKTVPMLAPSLANLLLRVRSRRR
jgi:protein-S-isoprenylcysteine O-methyltransferase Ste14